MAPQPDVKMTDMFESMMHATGHPPSTNSPQRRDSKFQEFPYELAMVIARFLPTADFRRFRTLSHTAYHVSNELGGWEPIRIYLHPSTLDDVIALLEDRRMDECLQRVTELVVIGVSTPEMRVPQGCSEKIKCLVDHPWPAFAGYGDLNESCGEALWERDSYEAIFGINHAKLLTKLGDLISGGQLRTLSYAGVVVKLLGSAQYRKPQSLSGRDG